ncbi:MAG: DNA methyltransferase [Armatimonadota bacterium]
MAHREPLNDLDLTRWREYNDLLTDSLWLLGRRDNNGVHSPEYWGNFVPQIPNQAIRRFTRRGELVIDPFMGLGTTLIEAVQLGRYGIGIDLKPECVHEVRQRLLRVDDSSTRWAILEGNSCAPETAERVCQQMRMWGFTQAHLLILHPPYHDIIRFSNDPQDLSNASSEEAFLERFEQAVKNFAPMLATGRFLVLVIGDKYTRGEWIPLGFYAMERVLRNGFRLKSICVKDIQENRGKRGQHHLWRYRALRHNFYVFKHEYVMFFEKVKG